MLLVLGKITICKHIFLTKLNLCLLLTDRGGPRGRGTRGRGQWDRTQPQRTGYGSGSGQQQRQFTPRRSVNFYKVK